MKREKEMRYTWVSPCGQFALLKLLLLLAVLLTRERVVLVKLAALLALLLLLLLVVVSVSLLPKHGTGRVRVALEVWTQV